MKKQTKNHPLSLIFLIPIALIITLFSPGCKKDKDSVATITNTQIVKVFESSKSDTIVNISADITSDGGNPITEQGFVFGTNSNPSVGNSTDSVRKSTTAGTGNFSAVITNILPNTTYYARAYATNSSGRAYGEQVTFSIDAAKIGSRFGGGIVFYVDGSGQHGLILSRNGLGYNGTWGCESVNIPGTQTALGTGKANTELIASSCSDIGIAAQFALDLVHNGYNDWFLPSKDELKLMYDKRNLAADLFSNETRWSSSQNDANTAWAQKFDAGGSQVASGKGSTHGARAVRAF